RVRLGQHPERQVVQVDAGIHPRRRLLIVFLRQLRPGLVRTTRARRGRDDAVHPLRVHGRHRRGLPGPGSAHVHARAFRERLDHHAGPRRGTAALLPGLRLRTRSRTGRRLEGTRPQRQGQHHRCASLLHRGIPARELQGWNDFAPITRTGPGFGPFGAAERPLPAGVAHAYAPALPSRSCSPAAIHRATPMIVSDGSFETEVGTAAPSATYSPLTRCASPVSPANELDGSTPSGAVPRKWLPAQTCALGWTDRSVIRASTSPGSLTTEP